MGDKLPVTVTVILPTRNEEEALGPTIDAIPRGWCKAVSYTHLTLPTKA